MATTQLRHKATGLYGVTDTPVPRYFAFRDDDGDLVASIYSDAGTWIEDRATLTGGAVPHLCVTGDPLEAVSDGTAVWRDGATIHVWDVDGEDEYDYTAGAGLTIGGPLYMDGWLYWWEYPSTYTDPATVTLKRAHCDLTSDATIGDDSIDDDAGIDNDSLQLAGFSLNTAASIASFLYSGGEQNSQTRVRVTIPVGASTTDEGIGSALALGHPDAAFNSAGIAASNQVLGLDDSVTAVTEARWPTTDDWAIDTARSFGVSSDRVTGLLYGIRAGDTDIAWAVEAPSQATGGLPDRALEIYVGAQPDFPDALFLME